MNNGIEKLLFIRSNIPLSKAKSKQITSYTVGTGVLDDPQHNGRGGTSPTGIFEFYLDIPLLSVNNNHSISRIERSPL